MHIFEKRLEEASSFIKRHQNLADCHLVDFITGNLWETCLPEELRLQIEQNDETTFKNLLENCTELSNFTKQADELKLKNCPGVVNPDDVPKFLPHTENEFSDDIGLNIDLNTDFMKVKKSYEITAFSTVIRYLLEPNENLVIDVGAGKGYLGTSLSQYHGVSVLSIDSCPSRNKSAQNRQELIKKKKKQSFPRIRHSVEFIDDATDYTKLVKFHFPEWKHDQNFLLVGLHTCGNLAHAMIKSFLNSDSLKTLCVVSCCYHLTEELLTPEMSISKNARMLAQQSVERISTKDESISSSIFYRAVLQVFFRSIGLTKVIIGRGAPTDDFKTFCKWAFEKIGLNQEKIPTDDALDELYQLYVRQQWQMNIFQILRVHLGSVIETALVLDRVMYLHRDKRCSRVFPVRLFDPILSPRCYAIIACK